MSKPRLIGVLGGLAVLVLLAAPAMAQDAEKPVVMPHDLEGREQCLMCHSGAMPNIPGVTETHEGRTNDTCVWCHTADAPVQTAAPAAIPHDLEGKNQCLMCHSGSMPNIPGAPENHKGIGNEWCQMCHKPGESAM